MSLESIKVIKSLNANWIIVANNKHLWAISYLLPLSGFRSTYLNVCKGLTCWQVGRDVRRYAHIVPVDRNRQI